MELLLGKETGARSRLLWTRSSVYRMDGDGLVGDMDWPAREGAGWWVEGDEWYEFGFR